MMNLSNAARNALANPHYNHVEHTKDKKTSVRKTYKKPKILRGRP